MHTSALASHVPSPPHCPAGRRQNSLFSLSQSALPTQVVADTTRAGPSPAQLPTTSQANRQNSVLSWCLSGWTSSPAPPSVVPGLYPAWTQCIPMGHGLHR